MTVLAARALPCCHKERQPRVPGTEPQSPTRLGCRWVRPKLSPQFRAGLLKIDIHATTISVHCSFDAPLFISPSLSIKPSRQEPPGMIYALSGIASITPT